MHAIQPAPLALPPRRFFKETDHNGFAIVRHPWLNSHEEGPFIDRVPVGFLEIRRKFRWETYPCPKDSVVIVVNAAKGEALASGDWEAYESVLVPSTDKHMWKICWSVARRLAHAHPGCPALIADGEWNAFDHVELSPFHNRSIGYAAPMPAPKDQQAHTCKICGCTEHQAMEDALTGKESR